MDIECSGENVFWTLSEELLLETELTQEFRSSSRSSNSGGRGGAAAPMMSGETQDVIPVQTEDPRLRIPGVLPNPGRRSAQLSTTTSSSSSTAASGRRREHDACGRERGHSEGGGNRRRGGGGGGDGQLWIVGPRDTVPESL